MPTGSDGLFPPAGDTRVRDVTTVTDLPLHGALPGSLSGQYTQLGPSELDGQAVPEDWADGACTAQALRFGAEGTVSYRSRWIGVDLANANLLTFGNTMFALAEGQLAYEISASLDTIKRVDLAGAGRALTAHATLDARTGELHLLTFSGARTQLLVTVSRAALTRTVRSLDDAPSTIHQLAVSGDDIVLL